MPAPGECPELPGEIWMDILLRTGEDNPNNLVNGALGWAPPCCAALPSPHARPDPACYPPAAAIAPGMARPSQLRHRSVP